MSMVRLTHVIAKTTIKEWSSYRVTMLISIFTGPVFFTVNYFIWHAVYKHGAASGIGLDLNQVITYFGLMSMLGYALFDSTDVILHELVRTGNFISFLIRPVSFIHYAFAQKLGHRFLALLLELIPVYFVLTLLFKITLIPFNFFYSVLSLALGFIMMFLLNFLVGTAAFWLTKTEGIQRVMWVIRFLLAGFFIPLSFFPLYIQKILFFLPFQFIIYVPARVFIGSYQLAGYNLSLEEIMFIQLTAVILMALVSALVWHQAKKRFTGVGV